MEKEEDDSDGESSELLENLTSSDRQYSMFTELPVYMTFLSIEILIPTTSES
jgi:hypothetical protein